MANSFHEEFEAPEMDDIASLAENIVYRLPGVDNVMVRKTLQVAYADFARLSCCFVSWRDIETEEDVSEYRISPAISGMNVSSVSDVRVDGRRLVNGRDYALSSQGNSPVVTLRDNALRDDPCTLSVRTVELPKYNSEKCPKWFIEKYGEAVVSGALVKLYGMTGRTWANADMARQEMIRYENFCTDARVKSFAHDGSQFGSSSVDVLDTSVLL